MKWRFRDWLRCPACRSDEIGVLAYNVDVVLECYDCGEVAEFELGRDVPFNTSDPEELEETADDQSDEDGPG